MSRTAKQIIILGFNGTGKTTLTRKFVERALKSNERVLVVIQIMLNGSNYRKPCCRNQPILILRVPGVMCGVMIRLPSRR